MKKALAIIAGLFVVSSCLAEGWSVTVTTNATAIAPIVESNVQLADGSWTNLYSSIDWSATNLTANTYAKSGGLTYWTPNGGSCTNAPSHKWGVATGADGVTWVVVNRYQKRKALIVSMKTTSGKADVITGFQDATLNSGVRLNGEGAAVAFGRDDQMMGGASAISVSGSVVIGVEEVRM